LVTCARCANETELSQLFSAPYRPLDIRIGRPSGSEGEDVLLYTAEGVIEHADLDQIASIHSATTFAEMKRELAKHGQVLPFVEATRKGHRARADSAPIGEIAAMNIPHPGESLLGGFRDWVLGLTVVLADGRIVKCGSKAVKSVAGYDVHKLFVGARHTLGVVTQITFRTYPAAAFDGLQFDWVHGDGDGREADFWIQRTRRTDFDEAIEAAGSGLSLADRGSSTLWSFLAGGPRRRFPGDWVIWPHGQPPNVENVAQRALMKALKAKLDPYGNLNPGGFSFL
jgi:glycolate oxidase FAD binding subunit